MLKKYELQLKIIVLSILSFTMPTFVFASSVDEGLLIVRGVGRFIFVLSVVGFIIFLIISLIKRKFFRKTTLIFIICMALGVLIITFRTSIADIFFPDPY
ncbi:MAG: hypothetical protein A3C71_01380 [Candidatus Yanofskybacteria bacterium RIFCSPHIGHO2_02_FULL_43_15c]|uniref:Uncharacterized protein n=1 Tax=Candidatus Yanofskybacteria bacterium RIFCSPHIGHO2_02_FULL_43_15c TaxID=1802679 RepID=A0A1F8FHM4_9BACT|nr:MAG: hypothetical protein A3C71_01380 [Candidatus Yanofskybacteria bacterium RIFCSPHIGHO2_02_FULL_43_15c]